MAANEQQNPHPPGTLPRNAAPSRGKQPPWYCDRPRCLVGITVLAIFLAELLLLGVLYLLPPLPLLAESLLNALLLSVIVFPVLFFLLFRPMRLHIDQRKEAEAAQEKLILELQKALTEVKTLSGLLPICANCKKIRDDQGYWNQIESFLAAHANLLFSHSICPECIRALYPEIADDTWPSPPPSTEPPAGKAGE